MQLLGCADGRLETGQDSVDGKGNEQTATGSSWNSKDGKSNKFCLWTDLTESERALCSWVSEPVSLNYEYSPCVFANKQL